MHTKLHENIQKLNINTPRSTIRLWIIDSTCKIFFVCDGKRIFNMVITKFIIGFNGCCSLKNNKSITTHRPAGIKMLKPITDGGGVVAVLDKSRQTIVKMHAISAEIIKCKRDLIIICRFCCGVVSVFNEVNELKRLPMSIGSFCNNCWGITISGSTSGSENSPLSMWFGPGIIKNKEILRLVINGRGKMIQILVKYIVN